MPHAETTLRILRRTDALFLGRLPSPARVHSHHAIQGSISLEGTLRVDLPGSRSASLPSVLIASDEPHALWAEGLVGHFYVPPASRAGAALRRALSGRPLGELEGRLLPGIRTALRGAWRDPARLEPCLDLLVRAVAGTDPPPAPPVDPRVAATLRLLRDERGAPDLAALGRRVGLSPDRLRHLVKRDTGLTFRRHRRWVRLMRALDAFRQGHGVTEAAVRAQFADAAHLSRVFRESFSFPPRVFLRDSRFVQASRPGPG
jgi:AraC-like DNA-binding protein